ncbi:MAG: tetratricopeptide repeat protein [Anaerolineales bacterium]
MSESLKKLRIFAASPSDVASERAKLETVVDSLKPMADYLGLTLEVIDWRSVVPDAGRPQQIIFDQLKPTSWDIFIGILWHRFGTPPGAKDKTGKDYLSGTEEEFRTAYELWKQHSKPRMVLYRCTRALPFDVDPDQLKNVRAFFKLIEDVKGDYPTLYQAFDTTETLEKLLLDNLQKLLIEYGEQSKTPITPEVIQVYAPKIPNNLPRRAAFFGRTREINKVMRTIGPEQTWGIVIDGIGGIGKTAIAIESAHHAQDKGMFDAFVFVTAKTNILDPSGIKELNPPARTLDEFLNETARVLGQSGIAKLTGEEKRSALIDVLRSMRTLLIYDNLETLSKEEQEGIADFLRELPQGCKAIITSRRRGGEGGVWLRLEKLDFDAAHGIIKNQILLDEELANKLYRVGETRWQELFDETNGSPLALVHTLGLMRVRTTLTFDSALEMLRGNRDEVLQKFIFQEARKELTENDKAALGALSFFVPSAPFEAWTEVAELSRNALETTIDRLSALSLVDVLNGEERYALHPLTRAFVQGEMLVDAKVAREAEMRFAMYWVDHAKRYGSFGMERNNSHNQLELEWSNMQVAINILWKRADVRAKSVKNKTAVRILNSLASLELREFLDFSGRRDEQLLLNTKAYEASYIVKDWSAAGWRAYDVANIYSERGEQVETRLWRDRSITALERSNERYDLKVVRSIRGRAALLEGDYNRAEKYFLEALSLVKDPDKNIKNYEEFDALSDLGDLELKREQYDAAEHYLIDAMNIITDIDLFKGRFLSGIYSRLGSVSEQRGQLQLAKDWYEKALVTAREIGNQAEIAEVLLKLALVHDQEGHADLALPLAQETLKIYERLQHKRLAKVRELVERLEKTMKAER